MCVLVCAGVCWCVLLCAAVCYDKKNTNSPHFLSPPPLHQSTPPTLHPTNPSTACPRLGRTVNRSKPRSSTATMRRMKRRMRGNSRSSLRKRRVSLTKRSSLRKRVSPRMVWTRRRRRGRRCTISDHPRWSPYVEEESIGSVNIQCMARNMYTYCSISAKMYLLTS